MIVTIYIVLKDYRGIFSSNYHHHSFFKIFIVLKWKQDYLDQEDS